MALPIVVVPGGDGIDASCDEGVVRVIGRGYTGVFRGRDAPVAITAAAAIAAPFVLARKRVAWTDAIFLLAGAAPIAWMLWRRAVAPEASIDVGLFASPLGEGARAAAKSAAITIARSELG